MENEDDKKLREEKLIEQQKIKLEEHGKARINEIEDKWIETNGAIVRIISENEKTIENATKTAEKLKEQTEKIERLQRELDDLGDGLKRAGKELNTVFRNFYKDYIIIGVFGIIILSVTILIIARIVMFAVGKSGVNSTGSNSATS